MQGPRATLPLRVRGRGSAAEILDDLRSYIALRRMVVGEPPTDLAVTLSARRGKTFRDTLLGFMRERGAVDSRVCAAAGIDRRHYSKIRNTPDYRPTKTTVVSFVFALRLCLADAEKLLRSAGYAFSEASDFDLICSYFIESGRWDRDMVNDALYTYGQPLICGVTLD